MASGLGVLKINCAITSGMFYIIIVLISFYY